MQRQSTTHSRTAGFTLRDMLMVIAVISVLLALLVPAITRTHSGARRNTCMNNLRQLGLAAMMYEAANNRGLPPGVTSAGDDFRQGMHSGIVFMLPYLEEALLYDQYDMNLPWNVGPNAMLNKTQLQSFLCPSNPGQVLLDDGTPGGRIDYAFCKGPLAYLCSKPAGGGAFDINSRVRTVDITDGASKTFLMGEAISSEDQPPSGMWSTPDVSVGQLWASADLDGSDSGQHLGGRGSVLAVTAQNPGPDGRFGTADDVLASPQDRPVSTSFDANPGPNCADPQDRVRGFASMHPGIVIFIMADGSARQISDSIDPKVYRALSTIAGGEANVEVPTW